MWEYRDFSEAPEIFLEIVRRTEGTGLGVNIDTGNPLVQGEDPLPLLRRVVPPRAAAHAEELDTLAVRPSLGALQRPILSSLGPIPEQPD